MIDIGSFKARTCGGISRRSFLKIGASVPVAEGRPVLGTWQQIFHLECDVKPRQRTIVVTVMGQ